MSDRAAIRQVVESSNPAKGDKAMFNTSMMVEKFSTHELTNLRNGLLQSGLDIWQAAELISNFLVGRGYGVSSEGARDAATRIEGMGCNLSCMQEELEKLAMVM